MAIAFLSPGTAKSAFSTGGGPLSAAVQAVLLSVLLSATMPARTYCPDETIEVVLDDRPSISPEDSVCWAFAICDVPPLGFDTFSNDERYEEATALELDKREAYQYYFLDEISGD